MKDAYYFPHDSNARQDPKILLLLSIYGYQGYGWYWALIETMRDQSNYMYPMRSQYVWNAIADLLKTDADTAKKFVTDCIDEFKLFDADEEYLWSPSFLRRMEKKDEKTQKARSAALQKWENKRIANAMQTHSVCNAIKEKKSKVKEKESQSVEGGGVGEETSPPADRPKNISPKQKVINTLRSITLHMYPSPLDEKNIDLAMDITNGDADLIVAEMERISTEYSEREAKKPENLRKRIKNMAYFLDGLRDAVERRHGEVTRSGTSPPAVDPYDAATERVLSIFERRINDVRPTETG